MGQFLIAISAKEDSLFPKSAREIVFAPQVVSPLKRSYYRNWDKIKSKNTQLDGELSNIKTTQSPNMEVMLPAIRARLRFARKKRLALQF